MEVKTTGIENEGWSGKWVDGLFVPADVTPLARKYQLMNGHAVHGHVTTEPGPGSIELAGAYSTSLDDAVANVYALHTDALGEGHEIRYQMCSPFFDGPFVNPEDLKKSRYKALFGAAKIELESLGLPESEVQERLSRMGYLNVRAATHWHLGFGKGVIDLDHIDQRLIFLLNVSNYVGPWFARTLCRAYDQDNEGHLGITWGWGDPRRFCRPDIWFLDFADFRRQFESLKRMMRPVGEADPEFGEWQIDLKSSMEWGNPADWKTGYWPHVRPRPDYETVEVRLMPSLPLPILGEVSHHLVDFVNCILHIAPQTMPRSIAELKESRAWRHLTSLSICGQTIPRDYDEVMWNKYVFC